MPTNLAWTPDRYQPHSELIAEAGGVTYWVSSWHPTMTSKGRRLAFAGAQPLGEFPCTDEGMAAALKACQTRAERGAHSIPSELGIGANEVGS